ncbi:DUF4440 domain-containing protein [Bacillus sp. 31A1R]|uniref:DUF4440 domain-containing protein n=1 Tax=Robertmurraya mangrovi TaxID=3098077 RepID=A0ABU5J0Z7_9BACI|nr:DUF4440 domain-containing protein [Bacillus sp. 31A1R]MDZ5473076.1 DUF4440 domain-containing protein [Bacillus sp. 31A1R]
MLKEALKAVENYRKMVNGGDVNEVNAWISNDFIGYFGYYNDRDYEVYTGESYKQSNVETFSSYEGKSPYWDYHDLTHNMRSESEIIISSIVDFYLSNKKVATALAMEVFRKENEEWKLYRQHMERYADVK